MTCWKIIQKAGPNVLAAFIQIVNIVYPPEKADMLVFKIVRVYLFSSAGQQNVTKLRNVYKCSRRTNLPLKTLPPTRIALIAYVESTLESMVLLKAYFAHLPLASKAIVEYKC